MRRASLKWIIAIAIIVIVASVLWMQSMKGLVGVVPEPAATSTSPVHTVIGKSVQGRNIDAYTFGTYGSGAKRVLFVGGIHGGYEWNSVLLAYTFMDHLAVAPELIPVGVSVAVIPSANPDGVYRVVGKEGRFSLAETAASTAVQESGRFNAHAVDLNRNFDCKWQPTSTWRSKTVSAGAAAFSEPESAALRDFITAYKPDAVIFWHSQSNAVYASQCEEGILPATRTLMNTYAMAAGYPAVDTFDAYVTTGAADDWLASIGIPAITVELSTHESTEWEKNMKGIRAVVKSFGVVQ